MYFFETVQSNANLGFVGIDKLESRTKPYVARENKKWKANGFSVCWNIFNVFHFSG